MTPEGEREGGRKQAGRSGTKTTNAGEREGGGKQGAEFGSTKMNVLESSCPYSFPSSDGRRHTHCTNRYTTSVYVRATYVIIIIFSMISRFSRCFAATSSNVGQANLSRIVLSAFEEGINKSLPTGVEHRPSAKPEESRDQNLSLNYLNTTTTLFSSIVEFNQTSLVRKKIGQSQVGPLFNSIIARCTRDNVPPHANLVLYSLHR